MLSKEEAKDYVHKTLATGNKERIQEVLKRYLDKFVFVKSAPKDNYDIAKEIFNA